jgi:ankyrin repeat protein
MAAAGGCESAVRLLLEAGATIDATDDDGTTALMEAANVGLLPIVQLLLDKGADLEVRNKSGQNAWLLAAMGQKLDVVELFRKTRGEPKP